MIEFIIVLLIGYVLGRYNKPEEKVKEIVDKMGKTIENTFKDKPTPGVVKRLTPEEIAEKHDPNMQAAKENFDRLFESEGIRR